MSEEVTVYVKLSESAQDYLKELLSKQEKETTGVRIFVENPGTPAAECCMAYCLPGEQKEGDILQPNEGVEVWVEEDSVSYLKDAEIDFSGDRMGGQLTFRAPKAKIPQNAADASLEERINYILYAEVNPMLASHGGHVSLIELTDNDETAVLQFGGGCQGCSAVDMTLKGGVEKTLIEQIPELKQVKDVTDHSNTEQAYY